VNLKKEKNEGKYADKKKKGKDKKAKKKNESSESFEGGEKLAEEKPNDSPIIKVQQEEELVMPTKITPPRIF